MTPPHAPRRLTWAIAGRLARGLAIAFMLVWLVALVAWPERREVLYRKRGVPLFRVSSVIYPSTHGYIFDVESDSFRPVHFAVDDGSVHGWRAGVDWRAADGWVYQQMVSGDWCDG